MKYQRIISLKKEKAKLSTFCPNDDIISNYSDFLKHRDLLPYYKYNQKVFEALISLTYELWYTNKRINRPSLLETSKRYLNLATNRNNIPTKTALEIFKLFQDIIIYQKVNIPQSSKKEVKEFINSIMIDLPLKDNEIKWLCDNFDNSKFIENRILRYPTKNSIISEFIKKNFHHHKAHFRRAEYASWLIDCNHSYEIKKEVIKKDFKYILMNDRAEINQRLSELEFTRNEKKDTIEIETTFFNRLQRFFPYKYIDYNNQPDFVETEKYFFKNIDIIHQKVMIWSIAYSRLLVNEKIKLFKKYYSDELYKSFFVIGKKLKSKKYYDWLISKQ